MEVKGTTGAGVAVSLTAGEVGHAGRNAQNSVLLVVAGIQLRLHEDVWKAEGGEIVAHEDPWIVDHARLSAVAYRYRLN